MSRLLLPFREAREATSPWYRLILKHGDRWWWPRTSGSAQRHVQALELRLCRWWADRRTGIHTEAQALQRMPAGKSEPGCVAGRARDASRHGKATRMKEDRQTPGNTIGARNQTMDGPWLGYNPWISCSHRRRPWYVSRCYPTQGAADALLPFASTCVASARLDHRPNPRITSSRG